MDGGLIVERAKGRDERRPKVIVMLSEVWTMADTSMTRLSWPTCARTRSPGCASG
jgi:hypothetical protein